jgi:uncharacterized protein (TIGR03382 family)
VFFEYGLIGSMMAGVHNAVVTAWNAVTQLGDGVLQFSRDNPAIGLAALALLVGLALVSRRRR